MTVSTDASKRFWVMSAVESIARAVAEDQVSRLWSTKRVGERLAFLKTLCKVKCASTKRFKEMARRLACRLARKSRQHVETLDALDLYENFRKFT